MNNNENNKRNQVLFMNLMKTIEIDFVLLFLCEYLMEIFVVVVVTGQ